MVKYILKDCPNEDRSYLTLYQLEQILASVKRPGNHCEPFQLLPDQIKTASENYGRLIHDHLKPKGNLKGMIQQFKSIRNLQVRPRFSIETVSGELDKLSLYGKTKTDISELVRILGCLSNLNAE